MNISAALLSAMALAAAVLSAPAALAGVEYKFDNGGSGSILDEHFSFTYVSPSFITPPVSVMPQTCDAGTYTCMGVDFYPPSYQLNPFNIFPAYDVVGFKANGENFYYFSPMAFSTPGTYNDALSGRDTLTISEISAAPEPASWLLLFTAVALAGLTLQRRSLSSQRTASAAA